jgi:phenylacetate-CoA ligase
MFINSTERLEILVTAREELARLGGTAVPESFYRHKIARSWQRARGCAAYRDIGDFSWDAFTRLPATRKEELKSDPWRFAAARPQRIVKYYETSGTTGRVTPTPRLAEDIIWNVASVADAWQDVIGADDRVVSLLPSDIVPVGDLVAGVCEHLGIPHARAYPFATGISDWDRLVTFWDSFRPTAVFLAPGVALQATRLLTQRGVLARMSGSVRSLMLLGEVSVPALRSRIGDWWQAAVYDGSYGSTETGTLAAACPADRLHLLTAANYFECIVDGRTVPLPRSGQGRLVVTPLNLYARPLLRYDTGDEVSIAGGCTCGRSSPVVEVLGRATDGVPIGDVTLSPRAVEEIVYGMTTATGYLLEVDAQGQAVRLLLERGISSDRGEEPAMSAALQARSQARLGLSWEQVLFVNTLPSTTKSGGSQKSWKRSNIRILESR